MSTKIISLILLITIPCIQSCEKKDKSLQISTPGQLKGALPEINTSASSSLTATDKGWSVSSPIIEGSGDTERPVLASDGSGNVVAVWSTTQKDIQSSSYNFQTGWATPVLLGATKRTVYSTHHVSMSKNGNAIAIWIQNITGAGFRIFTSQYVKSKGWSKGMAIDNGEGNVDDPFIATNANGNAIAVWVQSLGKMSHVWSNQYDVGKGWGTARQIETNDGRPSFPKASLDINGNAVIVWRNDSKKAGTHASIWANRFSSDKGWETATPIDNKTGHAYLPNILIDEKGDATAIWVQFNRKFDAIFANQRTVGRGWGNAKQIEHNPVSISTEDPHPRPYIAMDNKGNPNVIWYQCDENGGGSIWTNRFVSDTGWSEATLISNSFIDGPAEPQIAFDAEGNTIAVWEQQRHGIWSVRYNSSSGWQQAVQISPDKLSLFPQIVINPSGNAIVVWEEHLTGVHMSSLNYQIWNK